ncbi:isoflavone reductase family protein [Polychaeton citri CBS 116435]|uniref:Isoflavone reductase family protein n=1 Tax=Polychaeton citri CBS 116435 TaxID=1314669 RepID=A0A9P4Q2K6_9PEZI|nr:isoflavone reductase family protein [Polychaeton citri CBS 116435]
MSMMRIALAGSGGLAERIAHCIQEETSHQVVILSRTPQPQLTAAGLQVLVVLYSEQPSLQYALRGIDTVISTVTGPSQRALIRAAVSARVRRFATAEFEGPPELRSAEDPLDRERTLARAWLAHYRQHIQYTSFVCGIFYERFQRGGLQRDRIALSTGLEGEGDYILNIRRATAQAPTLDVNNQPTVTISLTSLQDVARFVTRALEIPQWGWDSVMRIQGERMTVQYLVNGVQRLTGRTFNVQRYNPVSLRSALLTARTSRNVQLEARINAMISTTAGRYDLLQSTTSDMVDLNAEYPDIQLLSFWHWLAREWEIQLPQPAISTTAE